MKNKSLKDNKTIKFLEAYNILHGKWFIIIFLLIFLLGSFLRFYQLGFVPGSMDWDEVSFGYNAYSILHTGKDEYGASHPLLFRAFGEYKQPVYAYLDVLSISLFGLNSFAVRFPSAFFGSLSIIFVYLLAFELFKKYSFAKNIALLTMLLYAISPWSIQFSRIAFEANVAVSLTIISVWLFLRGLSNHNKWYLFVSTILLCAGGYTYISLKLIGPLLFISLLISSYSYLKKQKIILGVILFLYLLGSAFSFLNSHSLARGQGVIFTNQQTEILQPSIQHLQYAKEHHDIFGEIIYNRRIIYTEKFIQNYLSHYNPYWLFFEGDTIPRHHAFGMDNLYIVSFPFILLGIFFLLTRALSVSWLIFLWFLIAPLASSLTSDAPSELRSLIFLPTWQLFEAVGIIYVFQMIKMEKIVFFLQIIFICLYTINFCYYINQYYMYTNSNVDYEKAWQYGYNDAVSFADKYKNSGKRIIFSNTFEQPYIFYLFYSQYDPEKYLAGGGSYRTAKSCFPIDNVYFGNCKTKLRIGDYYIALGNEIDNKGKEMQKVSYTNGESAVTFYQKQ